MFRSASSFAVHTFCLAGLLTIFTASCADQDNPYSVAPNGDDDEPGDDDDQPDDDDEPGNAGPIKVSSGNAAKGFLLTGTVIGPDGPYEGQVLTLPDGTIGCAEKGTACSKESAAEGAAHIDVKGIIAPGLIDTHNHILFDIFNDDDWLPKQPYQNHDQWTMNSNEPRYTVMVDVKQCLENASQGKPTWCAQTKYGTSTTNLKCEMEKWGEIKGLVAGTTSIVGLAGAESPCYDSLARSIDTKYNGLPADKVQTAAITPSKSAADSTCANFASGKTDAYLIHVGEGLDQRSRDEWTKLGALTTTPECLYAPQTAITHGTAFTATEFQTMKAKGMKLTWSPASNMALYAATTNIPLALDAGLTVSLAPDWSMGGSQNMLDEMAFAKKLSDDKFAGRLTAQDVFTMATANAAVVLALEDAIGTIKKGMMADIMVVEADAAARKKPYDTLVASKPANVRLTLVGGKALYGDATVKEVGSGGASCEAFDACGAEKFLCVSLPGKTDNKLQQTYAEIKGLLEQAMNDVDAVRPADIGGNFSPVAPTVACK